MAGDFFSDTFPFFQQRYGSTWSYLPDILRRSVQCKTSTSSTKFCSLRFYRYINGNCSMHWEMQKKEKRKQENLTAIVTSRYHSWKTILGAQKTLKSKKSNILEFFRVRVWREWKCQDQVKFKRFNQYIKATRLLAKQKTFWNGIERGCCPKILMFVIPFTLVLLTGYHIRNRL